MARDDGAISQTSAATFCTGGLAAAAAGDSNWSWEEEELGLLLVKRRRFVVVWCKTVWWEDNIGMVVAPSELGRLGVVGQDGENRMVLEEEDWFEDQIVNLAAAGGTRGCNWELLFAAAVLRGRFEDVLRFAVEDGRQRKTKRRMTEAGDWNCRWLWWLRKNSNLCGSGERSWCQEQEEK